jgi:hypothetical protein
VPEIQSEILAGTTENHVDGITLATFEIAGGINVKLLRSRIRRRARTRCSYCPQRQKARSDPVVYVPVWFMTLIKPIVRLRATKIIMVCA